MRRAVGEPDGKRYLLFVLRLSYHDVEGNLFAIPGRNPEVVEKRGLNSETNLLKLGVQARSLCGSQSKQMLPC